MQGSLLFCSLFGGNSGEILRIGGTGTIRVCNYNIAVNYELITQCTECSAEAW